MVGNVSSARGQALIVETPDYCPRRPAMHTYTFASCPLRVRFSTTQHLPSWARNGTGVFTSAHA